MRDEGKEKEGEREREKESTRMRRKKYAPEKIYGRVATELRERKRKKTEKKRDRVL